MRDILKTIKEHFILLFGTGLFTYGLFSFNHGAYGVGMFSEKAYETYYYYNYTNLTLLTIGAIFIVLGLLKARKKRIEN